jgi:hypothetical protein
VIPSKPIEAGSFLFVNLGWPQKIFWSALVGPGRPWSAPPPAGVPKLLVGPGRPWSALVGPGRRRCLLMCTKRGGCGQGATCNWRHLRFRSPLLTGQPAGLPGDPKFTSALSVGQPVGRPASRGDPKCAFNNDDDDDDDIVMETTSKLFSRVEPSAPRP